MEFRVDKTSPSLRVLTVTLPAEHVESAYRLAFEERRKTLRLKGFRKGNVPKKIAEKHLTDAHLVRRVINILVPKAYKDALKSSGLRPLGKPDWRVLQSDRGDDLIFEATVQIIPLLTIDGYRGMEIERPAVNIDRHRIEQIISQRRQGVARYRDRCVEHQAVLGDFCTIDYSASHQGKPLPHAKVSSFLLEMRQDKFLPGFVDRLVGAKSGQELEFTLRLPENYAHKKLAGEEVVFQVKIHQLRERQVPELDDEFARTHCKADSLEGLYTRVRRNLEEQEKTLLENDIANELVSRLASEIDLDLVPTQLQESHARLALRTQTQTLERQGLSVEKWLAERGVSAEHFSEELNLTGLLEARLEILYRSLAQSEDVVISSKEVDQAIVNQAKSTRSSPEDLKTRMLKEDTYKLLAYRLLMQKVRRRLLALAEITYTDDLSAVHKKTVKKRKSTSRKKTKLTKKKTSSTRKKKSASKKKTSTKKKKRKSKANSSKKTKTAEKKSG
jgi:trigger factor